MRDAQALEQLELHGAGEDLRGRRDAIVDLVHAAVEVEGHGVLDVGGADGHMDAERARGPGRRGGRDQGTRAGRSSPGAPPRSAPEGSTMSEGSKT